MLRSLIHYWRIHLAVILGAAVATSVLTGALLVGDSVEGSLRALTIGRLGKVDHAIRSTRYFRERLAAELASSGTGAKVLTAPVLVARATLQNAEDGRRANKVLLLGVDDRFGHFFNGTPVANSDGSRLRVVHANGPLMRAIGGSEEDAVILTVEAPSSIHREFLFGHDQSGQQTIRRRLRLGQMAEDDSGGRFSFEPSQSIPLVAYVGLRNLQSLIGREGLINCVLVGAANATTADIVESLHSNVQLEDYGLRLRDAGPTVSLETDRFLLSSHLAESARAVADDKGISATAVYTYLANMLSSGGRSIAYSAVSALGAWSKRSSDTDLRALDAQQVDLPSLGSMLLNREAAKRLATQPGDSITVRFFDVDGGAAYQETTTSFVLGETVRIEGLGGDASLTPDFPGLHDADNMADWDAPFPVDYGRIEDADEDYWDRHRATPRAFIALEDGQAMWASRFGTLTSVRFQVPESLRRDYFRAGLRAGLRNRLTPESQGIRVIPIREAGLSAAKGATDFRGLFIGFSMFLVVSALSMIAQLFKLGVADRYRELGLLKAIGYGTGRICNQWVLEGLLLGGIGAMIGSAGGVYYARVMIHGLSTWWVGAVGTRLLDYHGQSLSILIGAVASLLLVMIVVWRAVVRAAKSETISLLKNAREVDVATESGRSYRISLIFTLLGIGLVVSTWWASVGVQVGLFFATGACLLIAALTAIRSVAGRRTVGAAGLGLVIAQVKRFPGRTMASITLIALAAFILVAVGLNRHAGGSGQTIPPGAGGFGWMGETTTPVQGRLSERASLLDAGFSDAEATRVSEWDIHAFRLRPGEDISCLNLHRPDQPRILGVGSRTVARGGFHFQAVAEGVDSANPWRGLEAEMEDGVIPAIGDFNSVQWILHSGLGQDVVIRNEFGEPVRLRFVALLKGSVLQSEILISDAHFVRHFPSISGYSFFGMDTKTDTGLVESLLESRLEAYGMDMEATAFRLARYQAVENTYMATFQMIGGLGAVLGTLGVGVLMLRNAAERRGELAGMRAVGFSRNRLKSLLFQETLLVILTGVVVGALAGAAAVAPNLLKYGSTIPWGDVALSLGGIVLAGCVSGVLTASLSLRAPIVETLKTDF